MRFELAVASAQDGIDVYEVHSGTLLRSIVLHNNAGTFATLGDEYLINYQNDKAFVQIFSWKTGAMQIRSIVPEKLTSIAISNSQSYVVGGTGTGKVYVWSLGNGELVNCFHAHYKKVSSICFTSDDTFLITGGDDAVVNVWAVDSNLVNPPANSPDTLAPWVEWAQHSLPVTGLLCGVGGMSGRVVSCSLDRTCKVFDIPSKTMVSSFLLPAFVNAVTMDPAETCLYAAGGDGNIYKVSLLATPSAVTGQGQGEAHEVLEGHAAGQAVTCLSLSFNGSLLMSTALDGNAVIWDTTTNQCLRKLTKNRAAYMGAAIIQDPYGLMGKGQAQPTKSNKLKTKFFTLKRHVTGASQETYTRVRLRGSAGDAGPGPAKRHASASTSDQPQLDASWIEFFGSPDTQDLHTKLARQTAQQTKLVDEVQRWKGAHAKLYNFCTESVLGDAKE